IDVVLLEAVLVADLDRVAEALGGDERGLGALALDERVGRERRAVDDDAEIAGLELRLGKDDPGRLEDAPLGRLGPRQCLCAEALGPALERDVGEGAADIDAETGFAAGGHFRSLRLKDDGAALGAREPGSSLPLRQLSIRLGVLEGEPARRLLLNEQYP